MPTLRIGHHSVSWTAVRSTRARRIRIRVGPEGVIVTVPRGASAGEAEAFVAQKAAWIAGALERVTRWEAGRDAAAAQMVPAWDQGGAVPYRGGQLAFQVEPAPGRRVGLREVVAEDGRAHVANGEATHVAPGPRSDADADAHADADVAAPEGYLPDAPRLAIGVPAQLAGEARSAAVRDAVVRWLRARALYHVEAEAHAFGARLGRMPSEIRLGDQKSRWGSCATSGVVRVSWRLIMAPPEALAYVVAHEVAHLEAPHHGPAFWAAVARIHPTWADGKAMLKGWERSGRAAAGRLL